MDEFYINEIKHIKTCRESKHYFAKEFTSFSAMPPFHWVYHGEYKTWNIFGVKEHKVYLDNEVLIEDAASLTEEDKTFLSLKHNIKFL